MVRLEGPPRLPRHDRVHPRLDLLHVHADGPADHDYLKTKEGHYVISVDGHDFQQLLDAFEKAKGVQGKPTAIIARTVKGKGVSFMENNPEWHGKAPTPEQAEQALAEIGE